MSRFEFAVVGSENQRAAIQTTVLTTTCSIFNLHYDDEEHSLKLTSRRSQGYHVLVTLIFLVSAYDDESQSSSLLLDLPIDSTRSVQLVCGRIRQERRRNKNLEIFFRPGWDSNTQPRCWLCVDSVLTLCWLCVDSVLTVLTLCWLVLTLCWILLTLCWQVLTLFWLVLTLCWLVLTQCWLVLTLCRLCVDSVLTLCWLCVDIPEPYPLDYLGTNRNTLLSPSVFPLPVGFVPCNNFPSLLRNCFVRGPNRHASFQCLWVVLELNGSIHFETEVGHIFIVFSFSDCPEEIDYILNVCIFLCRTGFEHSSSTVLTFSWKIIKARSKNDFLG